MNADEMFPAEPDEDGFPSKLDKAEMKRELWKIARRQGIYNAYEWSERHSFESLLLWYRWLSHQIAAEKGISVKAVWTHLKREASRKVEFILKGTFRISEWHDRIFRRAFAIARDVYPNDDNARIQLATDILLENGNASTMEAWDAFNHEQLSLDLEWDVSSDPDEDNGDGTLLSIVADPSPTGVDPVQKQISFYEYILTEDETLSERQKDVAELLATEAGISNVEIARLLGTHEITIRRDRKVIRMLGISKGWIEDGAENT